MATKDGKKPQTEKNHAEEYPDGEEPKIETADFAIRANSKDMKILTSTADTAKKRRDENMKNKANDALMDAIDRAFGGG
ncbi:hypothetical protein AJ78_04061 [Emergomyces pasteurianus Ep9510]|uniref:Uncharacterized protein n=1 Tax=Emergomyces pasteurianus Ep9510 TaxID=1447872 RepID=A0A1J9QKG6_9EURO|nr:hypothetical protein AJ78_04061 [Emergomyces pasteurianus Ep9510]